MNLHKQLAALFSEVVKEAKANPHFAQRLEHALGVVSKPAKTDMRSHRRAPALFDPFAEYERGDTSLRDRLTRLNLEQLRDVVAQYGMDRSKLAMKWKNKNRVIDLIVNTIATRARKGDAFREPASQDALPATEIGRHLFKERGSKSRIRSVVLVKVERALPLISPAYDNGAAEEQVRASWEKYWESLRRVKTEETKE